jgi:hypothetical protein
MGFCCAVLKYCAVNGNTGSSAGAELSIVDVSQIDLLHNPFCFLDHRNQMWFALGNYGIQPLLDVSPGTIY